jgi:AcrR family transcriptional regulator
VVAVNPRNRYFSPLRRQHALATRRAVLDAGRELFIERGYAATTVDAIAQRAGVSKPTVFTAVGNKQALLRAVRDRAIAGDDEPVPVARRPIVARVRAEPCYRRAVWLLAEHLTGVGSRYAQIHEVVHAAADSADDGLRELWETEEQQRLTGAAFWLDVLAEKHPIGGDLDRAAAVDVLWLLMAPDLYYRLVHRRNWSADRYQTWLANSIVRLLFTGVAAGGGGSTR